MAECKKCGVKLNFSNNFAGICEKCYDNRHGDPISEKYRNREKNIF